MNIAGTRIFVTGGNGFLGRPLCASLRARGATVLAPRAREVDLLDRAATRRFLEAERPDAIIHLAARVGGIGLNQRHPGTLFHDNLIMGVQLIDEARRAGVKKIVAVGTVCAYPKFTPVPFREDAIWDGYPEETNAPYGLAKKMLLVQAQAYRAEFGLNAVVVFPANLYGPRDSFDLETGHVVPAMIRRFLEAKEARVQTVTLWGDGTPTRELLYVDDAVRGLERTLESWDSAEPLNIGTGEDIAIRDLAARVAQLVGYSGDVLWDAGRPNGQPRRKLDVSRARSGIAFEAQVSLDEGLKRTVAWYLAERLAERR